MTKETPAFPISSPSGHPGYMMHRDGMSMRDWFAGQVIVSIKGREGTPKETAEYAYNVADAMLEQRKL